MRATGATSNPGYSTSSDQLLVEQSSGSYYKPQSGILSDDSRVRHTHTHLTTRHSPQGTTTAVVAGIIKPGFHMIIKKHNKWLPHAPCRQFLSVHSVQGGCVLRDFSGCVVRALMQWMGFVDVLLPLLPVPRCPLQGAAASQGRVGHHLVPLAAAPARPAPRPGPAAAAPPPPPKAFTWSDPPWTSE